MSGADEKRAADYERAWGHGEQSAYLAILHECAKQLIGNKPSDPDRILIAYHDVRRAILNLCEDIGIGAEVNNLYLEDVVEKYLRPRIEKGGRT